MTISRMKTPASGLNQIVSWKDVPLLCVCRSFSSFSFQLEVELRALGMLDNCSTNELNAQVLSVYLFVFLLDFLPALIWTGVH